jgi:predicted TIM-barrel enzyme
MQYTRRDVLDRLRSTLAKGEALLIVGAGVGIVAKMAERSGADLVAVYNSGKYRMNGWPSTGAFLPVGNANDMALKIGVEDVLPVVRSTPVLAGVFAADFTQSIPALLLRMKQAGFAGVINFPTIGRLDGTFRRDLESLGFGLQTEVDMFKAAQDLDMFTAAYAYTAEEATRFVEAGVDVLVAHMGLTAGGLTGHGNPVSLGEAIASTHEILAAAKSANPDIISLCHGGPVERPDDVAEVLARTSAVGFVGASSVERIPVETALADSIRSFKSVPVLGREKGRTT